MKRIGTTPAAQCSAAADRGTWNFALGGARRTTTKIGSARDELTRDELRSLGGARKGQRTCERVPQRERPRRRDGRREHFASGRVDQP
jgi:hypothetical protein